MSGPLNVRPDAIGAHSQWARMIVFHIRLSVTETECVVTCQCLQPKSLSLKLAALQVAKLKAAGAVILGKGNMGEWAFSPTFSISSVAGAVRNPYDLDRTPAGSSGGPAAGFRTSNLILCYLNSD